MNFTRDSAFSVELSVAIAASKRSFSTAGSAAGVGSGCGFFGVGFLAAAVVVFGLVCDVGLTFC
jgi:hypothetical protein